MTASRTRRFLLLFAVSSSLLVLGWWGYSSHMTPDCHVHVVTNPARLRLFWMDGDAPIKTWSRLQAVVQARGERLRFATNGGIFGPALQPLGLYVEEGQEKSPLTTASGEGNFYMKPNGVFFVDGTGAHICSTACYAGTHATHRAQVRYAIQSGPMLVENGAINPIFRRLSDSGRVRSGVGVDTQGRVHFALTKRPVNFFYFAAYFRNRLGCPNALYLDGEISAMVEDGRMVAGGEGAFATFVAECEPAPIQ